MIVLLYVADALRSDFLSCYGFSKDTSPNIDELAKDAVLYENAYSTTTWTKPAAASMLTGRYPRELRMLHQMDALPEYEYLLTSLLKQKGYYNLAASANAFFSPDFGFGGFDEFFVLQREKDLVEKGRQAKPTSLKKDRVLEKISIDKLIVPHSQDINRVIYPLLRNRSMPNRFIMAWSADTHAPYYVKGERSFFGNSSDDFIMERDVNRGNLEKVRSLYCDMIRYNDHTFGELMTMLKREGLYDDSLIIFTSDHAECFGEHSSILGRFVVGHGEMPYEELIRIPLIVKYPRNALAGSRCRRAVQLTDIYPTIVKSCNIDSGGIADESLPLDLEQGGLHDDRIIFVESQLQRKGTYFAAVKMGNKKLIKADKNLYLGWNIKRVAKSILERLSIPAEQLYDLGSDPKEQSDIKATNRQDLDTLLGMYHHIRKRCDQRAEEIKEKRREPLAEDIKEQLKALGYVD